MLGAKRLEIRALASRDPVKAATEAGRLGIPRSYGSYEELLADPEIEAVYVPLPNHLHVEWAARAARAGKHVLCEKPIAMDALGAEHLAEVQRETKVLIAEAFMVRSHPQWKAAKEAVDSGRIGTLRHIDYTFSYSNPDPANIRNRLETGGGALLDIGCYAVNTSRWLFDVEPLRAMAMAQRDPVFGTDRLTSVILEYPTGHATFTCATQLVPYERVQILGSAGRIEIKAPLKAPPDMACSPEWDDGQDVFGAGTKVIGCTPADQFVLQADAFSMAVRTGQRPQNSIDDAVLGMRVIDAIFRSARSGRAEAPQQQPSMAP
jgi:predicted dehydrogenase